jgi:hypothetical protein
MVVMSNDVVTSSGLALSTLARAKKPKQLQVIPEGHFEQYDERLFNEKSPGTARIPEIPSCEVEKE